MTDILEMIDDLRELHKLYTLGEICELDFQDKIRKYESTVDRFEQDIEDMFSNVPV